MSANKKAVNLSVDAALLRAARDRGINLSGTLERALEDALSAMQTLNPVCNVDGKPYLLITP